MALLSVPTLVFAPIYSYAETPAHMPETPDPIEIPAEPRVREAPTDRVECRCVSYLRIKLGVPISGDAKDIVPNTELADITIGTVILFNYDGVFHAAVIISLHRDEAVILESNYRHCEETRRTIKLSDPAIRGYYQPPPSI